MTAQTHHGIDPSIFDRLRDLQAHTYTVCISCKTADPIWQCAEAANRAISGALKELDTARRALEALDGYQGGTGV